jgi:hypothetical protein
VLVEEEADALVVELTRQTGGRPEAIELARPISEAELSDSAIEDLVSQLVGPAEADELLPASARLG